jgi:hypothetical protein
MHKLSVLWTFFCCAGAVLKPMHMCHTPGAALKSKLSRPEKGYTFSRWWNHAVFSGTRHTHGVPNGQTDDQTQILSCLAAQYVSAAQPCGSNKGSRTTRETHDLTGHHKVHDDEVCVDTQGVCAAARIQAHT